MDFEELIKRRRAIRDYLPKEVPLSIIHDILDDTRFAPSARNGQPCKFVIVRDKTWISRLSKESKASLLKKIKENPTSPLATYASILSDDGFNVFYNAPCLILICVPKDLASGDYDSALAAAYLMFSAANRGLGTCWIGLGSHLENPDTLKDLGIPSDHRIAAPIILGYPKEIPPASDRHDPIILNILDSR
ncbi:MAG: nitroreductase family protein [Syntrophales bacterium]|nr:nitroreductase family protein [Syntrophales bacterium]